MRDRTQVVDEVLSMLSEIASIDRATLRSDTPLLGKSIGVDSLMLLRLIVRIEERFPGSLRAKDPEEIDFSSIDALVDCFDE